MLTTPGSLTPGYAVGRTHLVGVAMLLGGVHAYLGVRAWELRCRCSGGLAVVNGLALVGEI